MWLWRVVGGVGILLCPDAAESRFASNADGDHVAYQVVGAGAIEVLVNWPTPANPDRVRRDWGGRGLLGWLLRRYLGASLAAHAGEVRTAEEGDREGNKSGREQHQALLQS